MYEICTYFYPYCNRMALERFWNFFIESIMDVLTLVVIE